jgi:hypothetical protein
MLSKLDTALFELDQSKSKIERAQRALGAVRNISTTLAPINTLPAKIMVNIFALTNKHCKIDDTYRRGSNNCTPFVLGHLAAISKRWHQLSSEARLWRHIDLTTGGDHDDRHLLCAEYGLRRTGQLPLHVHIVEGDSEESATPMDIVRLLAPSASRIVSLHLMVDEPTAHTIVLGLFGHNTLCSVQEFSLFEKDGPNETYELGVDVFYVLFDSSGPLRTFNLCGPVVPTWQTFRFSGLTELKLIPRISESFTTTPTQVAHVLSACPELRSLALIRMKLGTTPGASIQPAFLPKLEALDLRATWLGDVRHILSLITVSSSPLSFGFSVDGNCGMKHVRDLQPLGRSTVTRLCISDADGFGDCVFGILSDGLTSVEELAVCNYDLVIYRTEGHLNAERFPRLHTLHMLACTIDIDSLCRIIGPMAVRLVQLDDSTSHCLGARADSMKRLSKIAPSVQLHGYYEYFTVGMGEPPLEWPLSVY